jgi:hypothetical protein
MESLMRAPQQISFKDRRRKENGIQGHVARKRRKEERSI